MTGPPGAPQPPGAARPADVDTGFWLWLAALPLMTTGYVVSMLASAEVAAVTYPIVGLTAVVVLVVVTTFLMLMRSGYRWARTLLTGGALAAVVYAVSELTHADARPAVAVTLAATGIIGSVLIAAGTFLLHRTDAQEYFTR